MSAERAGGRRRRGAGPGWIATAAGALLLVGVGFAVGLVAGAAFEEPGLVADHLAGRTTEVAGEVPGDGTGPAAAAGDRAAATPEPAPPSPPATARRPLGAPRAPAEEPPAEEPAPPAPQPEAAPPAVAAAPPSAEPPARDGFAIQVGAFAEREAAEALAEHLRSLRIPVYVAEERGHAPYKVRVGPIDAREEAERLAARLKTREQLPTWILSQEGR